MARRQENPSTDPPSTSKEDKPLQAASCRNVEERTKFPIKRRPDPQRRLTQHVLEHGIRTEHEQDIPLLSNRAGRHRLLLLRPILSSEVAIQIHILAQSYRSFHWPHL